MSTQRPIAATFDLLAKQLKGNPVNWALLGVFFYMVKSYATPNQVYVKQAEHPEVLVFRNYTPIDLLPFDGNGPDGRILMGVNGSVYDVSRGRNFYGPGGPYANFAGHDASRGLAKNSFDLDMLVDANGPIDKLEDLPADEWESLRDWEQHFASKYLLVDTTSYIMQLPDELQIKILAELPVQDLLKSTTVCRKWSQLAFDGSLWSTIDVAPFYKTIPTDYIIKLIKSAGRFLKTANFRGCIQLTGHALKLMSEYCPNLQVLILKDCKNVSEASLIHFFQKKHITQNLRVLDVSNLDIIKDSVLLPLRLPNLEKLNIGWCKNMTGPGLIPLLDSCSSTLRFLKLNGCPQLDNDTAAAVFGRQLPNLSHLSLASCTSLTDDGLFEFLKSNDNTHSHSNITHLNLSNCARLTDASLRHLSLYLLKLTHLEVAGCVLMTDQGFCYMSPRLRTLVHLDLEDLQQITGITVRSVANHQANLERLCLSNCTQISDDAIHHLILHGTCHKLQHLELDNCTITDEVLNTIAINMEQKQIKQQQQQKELLLSSISMTDSNISFFSSHSQEPPIKMIECRPMSVEVLDCNNITELGVRKALAKAGPMLTIKSFYSFKTQQELVEQENNSVSLESSSRSLRSVSRRNGAAGQPSAASCIIL
ncbi:RNI-like protein [Backusella circina FSU 941]|nr:RNI-like protein [Backusella circina FSU 941]